MYHNFLWTQVGAQRNSLLKLYEPVQPFIFLELARRMKCEVFVDVGANIGAYSVFLSSLDCIQRIYSFEAAPRTFDELGKNVKLNDRCDKIRAFNVAISDCESKLRFGIVGDFSGANGILSTSIHSADQFAREIEVSCVPLDRVVTEDSRNICIKIDVEGHESAVLAGARNLLRANRAFIQVENYAKDTSSLSEQLKSLGYDRILSIGPDMYFTNGPQEFPPEVIVSIVEKAASELINSNLSSPAPDPGRPLRVGPLPGIAFEVSGPTARFARRLREKFRVH